MLGPVRSLLYTPAINPNMLRKVHDLESDAFIFDLEDSVSEGSKQEARSQLSSASIWNDRGDRCLLVRINRPESIHFAKDIELVINLLPHAIVVPMATASSLSYVDKTLRRFENNLNLDRGQVKLVALIETAKSVCTLQSICMSTDRLVGLQFGAEDFTLDMGISKTDDGANLHVAKSLIAMHCHAYGLKAIDTPYVDLSNLADLENDCKSSRIIGMTAKASIHPSHLEIINQCYAPNQREIDHALRVIHASEQPENIGKGAFTLEGQMIDLPIIERARKLLAASNKHNLVPKD